MTIENETLELKRELMRQWEYNHSEHCGEILSSPLPHAGRCNWPVPTIIVASADELYLSMTD